MSFILEALKKSDKKNRDGKVPRLETIHRPVADSGSNRSKWIWLLPVLILNIGVLLWLFGPWRQPVPSQPVVQHSPSPESEAPAAALKTPQPAVASAPVVNPEPTRLPAAPDPPPPKVQQSLPAEKSINPLEVAASADERENRVYTLKELPLSIRLGIPKMRMSLHAFNRNSATQSLVRINDQFLREGDRLDNKYLLEKITVNGVIFRFDGHRFLIPRKQFQDE